MVLRSKLSLTRLMIPDVIIWTATREMRRPPRRWKAARPFSPTMCLMLVAESTMIREGIQARKMTAEVFHGSSN